MSTMPNVNILQSTADLECNDKILIVLTVFFSGCKLETNAQNTNFITNKIKNIYK